VTRRALSAAAVALGACVLVAWWPVGASAGGAGACLRLPQARVIYKQVFAVYPPAGRYVVTLSYGGVKELPMRTVERVWVILTDLRTGAEYRVFKGFFREGCCGSISNVMVRHTGSVVFVTSYAKPNLQFYLYACELSTCYDQRLYGRQLRVLDRGPNGVYNVRFDGATLRWTNADDGQEKSASLK